MRVLTTAGRERIADIASDCGRNADRQPKTFKQRRLLDMQLIICVQLAQVDRGLKVSGVHIPADRNNVRRKRLAGIIPA